MQYSRTIPSLQPVAAADPGLCSDCTHALRIKSDRGSAFLQCQLSFTDPKFARYPRLPVFACGGYQRRPDYVDEIEPAAG